MFAETGHIGAARLHGLLDDGEGEDDGAQDDKTQVTIDYHHILSIILKSFKDLQESGMKWTFRHRGKIYKDITLKFVVAFVKCDTDEADKLCGHYQSRGGVSSLCRYCTVPTADCDKVLINAKPKTVPMIKKLVQQNNLVALKELSQKPINNVFYELQFGFHNNQGIHGACPMEMLHALLLGIYKCVREAFFAQIGPTSMKATEIDGLAKLYGSLFARQSDRDLPKTNFPNGIKAASK